MSLVIFTGLAGIVVAPGHIHPLTAFTALLCIAIAAGASGALNMAYDSDIDALMSRTATRPDPAWATSRAKMRWPSAGRCRSARSTVMGLFVNLLAAALLAFTIFFYVVVYTLWLKRRTPQNIVIGGLSGALPPAIGWAAVTGSLSLAPLLLVAIIFMWTPPHFWALSLWRSDDYARAGVPMLPVVQGKRATRRQILALHRCCWCRWACRPPSSALAVRSILRLASLIGVWFAVGSHRRPARDGRGATSPPRTGCSAFRCSTCSRCSPR